MSARIQELKKVEDEVREYLTEEEFHALKELHRQLVDEVSLEVELREKNRGYGLVSYGFKGRMIPQDADALEWFGRQVQDRTESAVVVEPNVKFDEELLVRYQQ